jgi:hypothetical protein
MFALGPLLPKRSKKESVAIGTEPKSQHVRDLVGIGRKAGITRASLEDR